MDKVAKLKSLAKSIGTSGILGSGAGVLASEQIRHNNHSRRSKKGWETRRRRISHENAR